MIRTKFLFYRYYWIVAIIILLYISIELCTQKGPTDWKLVVSLITGTISYLYFVQKQKIEELTLFKDHFQEFNDRYYNLNDDLNRIYDNGIDSNNKEKDIQKLYNYFNLCGEEFLYYRKGYIFPKVWESWLNGMRYFYRKKEIKDVWNKELDSNSYYGFKQNMLLGG